LACKWPSDKYLGFGSESSGDSDEFVRSAVSVKAMSHRRGVKEGQKVERRIRDFEFCRLLSGWRFFSSLPILGRRIRQWQIERAGSAAPQVHLSGNISVRAAITSTLRVRVHRSPDSRAAAVRAELSSCRLRGVVDLSENSVPPCFTKAASTWQARPENAHPLVGKFTLDPATRKIPAVYGDERTAGLRRET